MKHSRLGETDSAEKIDEIVHFWFGMDADPMTGIEVHMARWYGSHPDFDLSIQERFGNCLEQAGNNQLKGWMNTARGALALVLLLDQFPRNIFRGRKEAFAYDAQALANAHIAIKQSFHEHVHPLMAHFLILPFEHSENLADQDLGLALCQSLVERVSSDQRSIFENFVDYARMHRELIVRFGRFPHRNEVLARTFTQDERDYLEAGGARFGQ